MRSPTDLPGRRGPRPARSRRGLVVAAAVIFFVVISLRGIAGFYTDFLWFDELKMTNVWRGVIGAKFVLGAVFTVGFFVLMWANLAIAERIAPPFRPMGPEEELVERYHEVVGARAGLVRTAVAALFALIAGPGAASHWNEWLLFRNQQSFGTKDPQFHRDIGFYVFQLPFLRFVVGWLLAALVIVLVVTAVAHYLNGGIRVQTPGQKITPQVKAHVSVLLGALALLKALGYYFQQFELSFSTRGVVQGATYTDVKAQLPALKVLIVISVFAAGIFLFNIYRRGWVLPAIAVALWAFISVVVGAAYPAFVQNFRVQPTESAKESPYIKRNIDATRAALNIDLKPGDVRDFAYNEKLDQQGLKDNSETIRNVRLWDPSVLLRSYEKLQEIRTFYKFNDADVDRYTLGGRTTQVLISARELNTGGVPSSSWVNSHLQYTHGFGAVVSPSNAVTPAGDPQLLVKDLPPQVAPDGLPNLQVDQPAIYYGEGLGGYAMVNTDQKEVDYPQENGTNQVSTYQGTGGVVMDSWVKRMSLALRFGDYNPVISGFITGQSRAVYIRDIRDRVRKAAPFLKYDNDPYPVILTGGDGKRRIYWVQDAYTTTTKYPNAQQASTARLPAGSGLKTPFNYARNSVKVVIDSYNGSMRFYAFDTADPILKAYQQAFPGLFTPRDQMSQELRAHLRYPEDLFKVQTDAFGAYHITDPAAFYNKADSWDIAQDPGSGAVGSRGTTASTNAQGLAVGPTRESRMDPYYLLMRLPNEQREGFVLLQPFVPTSKDDTRKDLSAFLVAKSDPNDYGKLEAFVMPRNGQVPGPALVDAAINNEPTISREITLLNTSGSKVLQGNLLVIPVNQSLLFIRPLYVEATGTPQPQFKKAIVVFGGRAVMRDSLKEALDALFGSAPPTQEQQVPGAQPTPGAPTPAPTPAPGAPSVAQLISDANAAFAAAQDALARQDLATFQQQYNRARDLIRQAAEAAGASSPPPGPAPSPTPSTTTTAPAQA